VTSLGIALRFVHLAASVLLVGVAALLLVAGRARWPTAQAWEVRMAGWARVLVLAALGSGLGVLGHQTAVLEGRAAAALDLDALLRVLLQTQGGTVWLVRHSVLLLLAAFLSLTVTSSAARADWTAARLQSVALGLSALALLAPAGHAAAVEPGLAQAIAADVIHLAGAGLWAGALPPLAALLAAAAREAGADARPHAVRVARRFSRLALAAMAALIVTGTVAATIHVGSVAALVGTPYGRMLCLKLGLLAPILILAIVNRRRLLPALSGEAATVGRPAMRRLARLVAGEAGLVLAVLAVVAAMALTAPARHEQPVWPFDVRLTTAVLVDAPEQRARVLVGSQVAVLGAVALAAALALGRWRAAVGAGGVVVLAAGLWLALPPLAIDAYPTTYRRPEVPYHAASIVNGSRLFGVHCAACHGPDGAGDGPAATALPRPPADLRAHHTATHTAGDLFWWITHGIPGRGMPGFGERLGEDERWDLINFVRVLSAAWDARALGPTVEPGRPWLVAPDFAFAVGPTPPRALRDYRGQRLVLLVLYTLPDSRPRLRQLAEGHRLLTQLGVEVLAVPWDAAPDAIRRLADVGPLYPVVTDGAAEIVAAYRRLAPAPHTELLVDRQGYVRARLAGEPGALALNPLLAEVQALNEEKVAAPPPDVHVH
jgi:putative copper export protein/mono/diheme cytochrome c family protein